LATARVDVQRSGDPSVDSLTDSQRDRVAGVDLVAQGRCDTVLSRQVSSCERKR
jgi:hypothetical protein